MAPFLIPALLGSLPPADPRPGVLHRHALPSALLGETRELLVRTPPGYDPAALRTYPVLILLHGVQGLPAEWIDAVGADRLVDDLAAQGDAQPVVLVMPVAYGFPGATQKAAQVFGAPLSRQRAWMEVLGRVLEQELLPFVEGAYRVRRDPGGRALAGFSMGGAEALYLGLRHVPAVGAVGAFSGALPLLGEDLETALPRSAMPSRVFLSCGQEDLLLGPARAVAVHLGQPLLEVPGAHTAAACRAGLRAFLIRCFP